MRRTETIKFGEFMNGEYKSKVEVKKTQGKDVLEAAAKITLVGTAIKFGLPVLAVTIPLTFATKALAAGIGAHAVPVEAITVGGTISDAMKEKIIHAFDPLVDLMTSLAAPIAGVMITGGALMTMIGMKEKGYGLIMSASLGYILVQISPLLLNLLFGVGAAI